MSWDIIVGVPHIVSIKILKITIQAMDQPDHVTKFL